VVGVLCSLVSVYYYLRVVLYMYFRVPGKFALPFDVPPALWTALIISATGVVVLGFWPSGVLTLAQHALLVH